MQSESFACLDGKYPFLPLLQLLTRGESVLRTTASRV
jgi:hypothetical protein